MTRPEVFPWRRGFLGACLCSFLLTGGVGAAPAPKAAGPKVVPSPTASPTVSPAPAASPAPSPTTVALSLNDIATKGQDALTILKTFGSDAGADERISAIHEAVPAVTKSIDDLHDQTAKSTLNAGSSIDTLRNLDLGWQNLIKTLVEHSTALGDRGRTLEAEADKLEDIDKLWRATLKSAQAQEAAVPAAPTPAPVTAAQTPDAKAQKAPAEAGQANLARTPNKEPIPSPSPGQEPTPAPEITVPKETLALVQDVITAASTAQKRIQASQKNILDLQNTVGALLARAEAGQDIVEGAIDQAVKTLLVRDNPPLWSADSQPKPDLAGRWRAAWAEETGQVQVYLDDNEGAFGLHLLVFLGLVAVFLYLRRLIHRWTEDEPHLKRAAPIFEVPVAAALAISFLVMGRRYIGAPSLLHAAVMIVALLPTVVILRKLLARRLYPMLYSLVLFTVTDQIRVATAAFPAVNRWLFCAEMLAAAGIFLWLLRAQKGGEQTARLALGRWMPFLCGLAVLIFAGALGATVLGYVRLGALLGTATLNSSYCAVFLYAALRVLEGLIVIGLRVRPVSASRIAQTHRDQVQAQVYAVFRAVAVLLWLRYTLEQLQIAQPLTGWVKYELTREIPLGKGHSFSLDQLLYFGLAIWLSLLVSRVLRFFLNEEVYERVQLAPGLPYAISTILNYAVLLIGFLIALGLLGIQLTQITIVAGAFSVGLGFGLQNIINNFVSGIILLFERPIKVGDVIQLGDATGEVRRIGIRASIIRTRDGSDIILPNGNMISNQVTNWTYADRARAVEITFNVATGPDPSHVLSVLKAAADREPTTQDKPAPEAYITGLLPNGFSVVVRAWTGHYEDWIEVRSELAAVLLGVLARENIKLV